MKRLIWLLALALLWSCKNDPQDTAGQETQEIQDPNAAPGAQGGSAAPAIAPGDSYFVSLLTKNYWVVEHWVNPRNDRQVYLANKGRWWNFQNDGTFETGIWQEKTGQGTWRIFQRGTDYWVFVDGENDVHDGEWKIQFNGPGTESSWVGSKDYASSQGIMAKFDNLLTMPTKEQYGIQ